MNNNICGRKFFVSECECKYVCLVVLVRLLLPLYFLHLVVTVGESKACI